MSPPAVSQCEICKGSTWVQRPLPPANPPTPPPVPGGIDSVREKGAAALRLHNFPRSFTFMHRRHLHDKCASRSCGGYTAGADATTATPVQCNAIQHNNPVIMQLLWLYQTGPAFNPVVFLESWSYIMPIYKQINKSSAFSDMIVIPYRNTHVRQCSFSVFP